MARPEPRINVARRQTGQAAQMVNAGLVAAASASAAAADQVTAAIEGDLIDASPSLALKIAEIDGRLDELEAP